jgi:hypothetical protein
MKIYHMKYKKGEQQGGAAGRGARRGKKPMKNP